MPVQYGGESLVFKAEYRRSGLIDDLSESMGKSGAGQCLRIRHWWRCSMGMGLMGYLFMPNAAAQISASALFGMMATAVGVNQFGKLGKPLVSIYTGHIVRELLINSSFRRRPDKKGEAR